MPRIKPPTNNAVLKWAIDESGFSADDFARRVGVPPATVEAWLEGEDRPSRGQLTKIGTVLRRPSSIFFLPAPPVSSSTTPTLRRARGRQERDLLPDEMREIRRALRTQRLVSWLLDNEGGEPLNLPILTALSDAEQAGRYLRLWTGISVETQLSWETPRQAFDSWRAAFESRGVMVMQLELGSEGLRGFSLPDGYAPLAAVNTAENVQARIFTLFHELAHITSNTGMACLEGSTVLGNDESLERWCEQAASSALLPSEALRALYASELSAHPASDRFDLVRRLADRFKTSLRATAASLIRAGVLPSDLYEEVQERAPTGDFDKGFARGRAQKAPERRLREVGARAASVVLDALETRRLTERDARQYLRLDGAELVELRNVLGTTL